MQDMRRREPNVFSHEHRLEKMRTGLDLQQQVEPVLVLTNLRPRPVMSNMSFVAILLEVQNWHFRVGYENIRGIR